MRQHVTVEVCEVVPDEQVAAGDTRPVGEVLHEIRLARRQGIRERTRKVALDVAEAHNHIMPWTRLHGCPARELIGERVDPHIREILFDRFSDIVCETQIRSGRCAAVLIHHRLALLTLATAAPIVLRHLYEIDCRILAKPPQRLLDVFRFHVLVGQAQLLRRALAFHERIPFRVFLEIDIRRQDLEEGMIRAMAPLEEVEAMVASHFRRDELHLGKHVARKRREVALGAHLEERVEAVKVVGLAILELRRIFKGDVLDGNFPEFRIKRRVARPPPHTAVLFEIEIGGVDRCTRRVAVEDNAICDGFQEHLVGLPRLRTQGLRRFRRANVEARRRRAHALPHDFRRRAEALAEFARQF